MRRVAGHEAAETEGEELQRSSLSSADGSVTGTRSTPASPPPPSAPAITPPWHAEPLGSRIEGGGAPPCRAFEYSTPKPRGTTASTVGGSAPAAHEEAGAEAGAEAEDSPPLASTAPATPSAPPPRARPSRRAAAPSMPRSSPNAATSSGVSTRHEPGGLARSDASVSGPCAVRTRRSVAKPPERRMCLTSCFLPSVIVTLTKSSSAAAPVAETVDAVSARSLSHSALHSPAVPSSPSQQSPSPSSAVALSSPTSPSRQCPRPPPSAASALAYGIMTIAAGCAVYGGADDGRRMMPSSTQRLHQPGRMRRRWPGRPRPWATAR